VAFAEYDMSQAGLKAPRYEVKACWEHGEKRFVIHDLQSGGAVVGNFDSANDACVQCTVLWLEHLKTARRNRSRPTPLTAVRLQEHSKTK